MGLIMFIVITAGCGAYLYHLHTQTENEIQLIDMESMPETDMTSEEEYMEVLQNEVFQQQNELIELIQRMDEEQWNTVNEWNIEEFNMGNEQLLGTGATAPLNDLEGIEPRNPYIYTGTDITIDMDYHHIIDNPFENQDDALDNEHFSYSDDTFYESSLDSDWTNEPYD